MRGINKVTLIGYIGNKTPLKSFNDSSVCNFSVATSESKKVNGEWEEETTWHRVVCWGNVATAVDQYMDKGTLVYVEGKIRNREYEANGVKQKASEIIAPIVLKLKDKDQAESKQLSDDKKDPMDIPF